MNAVVKHVTGAKPITLQTLARQMVEEAGSDVRLAEQKLFNYTSSLPRLADELRMIGVVKIIGEVIHTERRAIERAHHTSGNAYVKAPYRMNAATKKAQERHLKLGDHLREVWLNAKYNINGKRRPLREFVGSVVLAHGETQMMSGATQVRNARYLIAVGTAAGDKKVGEALREDDLIRMRREAESSAV